MDNNFFVGWPSIKKLKVLEKKKLTPFQLATVAVVNALN